jgi:hypothetical protein
VTPGGPLTASDLTMTSPRGTASFLETPRERQMLRDFLTQLAQQSAPREAQVQEACVGFDTRRSWNGSSNDSFYGEAKPVNDAGYISADDVT